VHFACTVSKHIRENGRNRGKNFARGLALRMPRGLKLSPKSRLLMTSKTKNPAQGRQNGEDNQWLITPGI
jgi:hypothetical protein